MSDLINVTVELTDEAIETDVVLNDDEIEASVSMDTEVTVLPFPDLATGGDYIP